MSSDFYPPENLKEEFHCPHCGVFAQQKWAHVQATGSAFPHGSVLSGAVRHLFGRVLSGDWTMSQCEHCEDIIIWKQDAIVYPTGIHVNQPNSDMNEEIQEDYREAARVLVNSPRSAAALLRLALQRLCIQLGEKGENINDDIASLVQKGLNPTIQKAMNSLRITGNNAVHPGVLDIKDNKELVLKMFELLNMVATKMITEPKAVNDIYDSMPKADKVGVKGKKTDGN